MKKFTVSVGVVMFVVGVVSGAKVFALDFGKAIASSDGQVNSNVWSGNTGGEDQSVQWNNETGQRWDLEGLFLKGSSLSLVSGYDFKNGYDGIYSGDIFIDTDGNIKYGKDITGLSPNGQVVGANAQVDGFKTLNNTWGYDYVIQFASPSAPLSTTTLGTTYNVYKIDQNAELSSGYYRQNDASGAYRYLGGGELVSSGNVFGYQTGLTDAQTGFVGDAELGKPSHYALTVDLSFLNPGTSFTAQYTMGCGNDAIVGQGVIDPGVVPEPGTLLLLGSGLLGLLAIARKRVR